MSIAYSSYCVDIFDSSVVVSLSSGMITTSSGLMGSFGSLGSSSLGFARSTT